MIKLVALLKRRPDVPLADFLDYYEHQHAPLFARSIPDEVAGAILYYVQNHPIQLGGGSSEPPFDCVTEFGFDDVEAMRRWTSWYLSDAGQVLRDDEERFMDTSRRVVIITEEHRLAHR
jgi:uncharacterized protein (TIGR02118 family)